MAHVNSESVVIRTAVADDTDALRYLAALDSARALMGDVLVAESNGIVRAAYSIGILAAVPASAVMVRMIPRSLLTLRAPPGDDFAPPP